MRPQPRTRQFRRVSAGGFSVRVFARDHHQPEQSCTNGQWCPPPECIASRVVEVDVVGEWTVTGGGGGDLPVRDDETARLLGTIASWSPQDEADELAFGVIVRAADGVQSVRLSAGGVTDEMAPIDGLAVLVVPTRAVDERGMFGNPPDATLSAIDASGATHDIALLVSGPSDPQCSPPPPPPPPLPAAGEQPADVAAADAAVRERFAFVFGPDSETKLVEGVDDPTGLDVLRDDLKARHSAAVGNVEYEVGEMVFVAPDDAAYQFRPIVSGRPLPWQIGGARLLDGDWMITRATVCAMYQLGGVRC